jgi:hypothetical protein
MGLNRLHGRGPTLRFGAGYIKNILIDRINSFIHRTDAKPELPLHVVIRKAFNPNGEASWFGAIWPQFLAVAAIGLAFFAFSIGQFRKSIAVTKQVIRRNRPMCRMDDWPFTSAGT